MADIPVPCVGIFLMIPSKPAPGVHWARFAAGSAVLIAAILFSRNQRQYNF